MADIVRSVTDEEVDFFVDHGWVHLPRLIDARFTHTFRERLSLFRREVTGHRGTAAVDRAFSQIRDVANTDDVFRRLALSAVMGANASRMLPGRPAVRLQVTNVLTKLPADGDGHGETSFDQDLSNA